jgi:hypothetical protein
VPTSLTQAKILSQKSSKSKGWCPVGKRIVSGKVALCIARPKHHSLYCCVYFVSSLFAPSPFKQMAQSQGTRKPAVKVKRALRPSKAWAQDPNQNRSQNPPHRAAGARMMEVAAVKRHRRKMKVKRGAKNRPQNLGSRDLVFCQVFGQEGGGGKQCHRRKIALKG